MEREKLEAELRQAQQRLEQVVISNPAILFTLTASEERIEGISWISDNLRQILGYDPAEALGREWWEAHIHPDDRDAVGSDVQTTLFATGQTANEYRFQHADGEYRWTKCRVRLIRDELGRPIEAVGVWLDVTDRKHAEHEQAKLRQQLHQAQKLESVARLAGSAAHDFNNLLTVINGYGDFLLKRLPVDDPLREYALEIRMAGARAAALSQQLLILSRKQIVQAVDLNLNDIVGEAGRMLQRVLGEDVRIQLLLDPKLWHVLADPGQMHQVLMNLALNARDAMPGGGTLFIETGNVELGESYADSHLDVSPGSYVRVKVSDTGVGMSTEVRGHLFEPFFTTKAPGEGTGLGLATVYSIVKQSGGSISVYSEPGQGSAFTIHLPRVERGTAAATEPEQVAKPALVRGTETILVVEDHEQVRGFTMRVLRESGYKVLEAAGPEEALTKCEGYDGRIDLLLTDVVMPGIDGRQLADRILKTRTTTAVLFMSAYSEPAIYERGVLPSSVNFLQKPFSPQALSLKIREVLGPPRYTPSVLIIDDDDALRNLLRHALEEAGFQVQEAANGRAAVEAMENAFDLLMIDLSMPEQDGFETMRAVRPLHPNARIIVMSGRFPELLRAAEHLGADAILAKPFRAEELFAVIGRLLADRQ